jgi:hypothetical protein
VTERVFVFRNASQSFPLNVSVDMYEGTSPVQLLETVPLLSMGIINITPSSITLSPQVPAPGSIFSVSMILTNIGTTSAAAVTATPLPPTGISSYGSNSVFVGDMSVDTQVPVTMTMQSNASLSSGSYSMPVRINYLNNLRENMSAVITVPLTIRAVIASNSTRPGANGRGGESPVVLLLLGIAVVAAFYAWKKGMFKRTSK